MTSDHWCGQINIWMSGRRERATTEIEGKPAEYGVSKSSEVFPEVGTKQLCQMLLRYPVK